MPILTIQPRVETSQPYVNFQMSQSGPVRVVEPDRVKLALKIVIIVGGLGVLIVCAILFLGFGDLINGITSTFGASLTQTLMLVYTSAGIIGVTLALIIYTITIPGNSRYEFYPDKVVARVTTGIALSTIQIPYNNVASIGVNTKDAIANALGTGTIILSLSGLERPQIVIEGVDNPHQTVADIQQALSAYTTLKLAEFEANARIDQILSNE